MRMGLVPGSSYFPRQNGGRVAQARNCRRRRKGCDRQLVPPDQTAATDDHWCPPSRETWLDELTPGSVCEVVSLDDCPSRWSPLSFTRGCADPDCKAPSMCSQQGPSLLERRRLEDPPAGSMTPTLRRGASIVIGSCTSWGLWTEHREHPVGCRIGFPEGTTSRNDRRPSRARCPLSVRRYTPSRG